MKCVRPVLVYTTTPDGMMVPCGRCEACRKAIVQEWSVRIVHELEYYKGHNVFVTLTYDDDHLPKDGCVNKRDVQLFLKRLRKYIFPRKIRYFIAAEYGDENLRPHYHCLMFGVDQTEREIISSAWQQGLIDKNLGYVSQKTAKYILKYMSKQKEKEWLYRKMRLTLPFRMMSKGLGKQYALDNQDSYKEGRKMTMKGTVIGMPRYYGKIIEIPEEVKKKKPKMQE